VSGGRETWRRATVRTCNLFFLLILLEGVLRKWLLNPIQQPLTLIRDPVLVVIYIQYLMCIGWRMTTWFVLFASMAVMFFIVIIIQATYLNFSADVYLIGLRNYLAYVPLSFVMYEIYKREDVNRFLSLFLYTTIPVAILVVIQFYSPVGSVLNKALDDSVVGIFQVVGGVVRPYGPFTFTYGQATYSTFALAVGLIVMERRKEISSSTLLLTASLIAIGSMGVVSGSRTYFLSAGVVILCYAVSALTSPRKSSIFRRIVYLGLCLCGLLLLLTVVFPQALETITERQVDAVATEGSTLDRTLFVATEMFSVIGDTPLFGKGIGFGSNAGAYAATGEVSFTLAEYEWTRIALECGPVLGLLVILARVLLTIWVGVLAVRTNVLQGDAAPLILYGFVAPLIFYSPISNQNTLISFGWFSLGLLLALIGASSRERI
jgi:hypothetical protein